MPYFVFFFPSSAKSGSPLLVQRRSVNFPEFPVLLLTSLIDAVKCCIQYSVSFSRSEFLGKGCSTLISRPLELALGYRKPQENRRYVFIFQCLHVISRPVSAFLLDNPSPDVCFCCTRLPLKSVADHTVCVE